MGFLPPSDVAWPYDTRLARRRHGRQSVDRRVGKHTDLLAKSALGMVSVYNLLPEGVVEKNTVSAFQKALQNFGKEEAAASHPSWGLTFCGRVPLYSRALRNIS